MKSKLISRAEFADIAGVSRATVTNACASKLKAACVGKRIDANHKLIIDYIANKEKREEAKLLIKEKIKSNILKENNTVKDDVDQPEKDNKTKSSGWTARRKNKKTSKIPDSKIDSDSSIPENIQDYADMSLRDLVDKFGTDVRFIDWLKAIQTIESINEKRLKNAKTEGSLVSRDLVRIGVIEPINSAHIKLLTDGSKTITRRATAMHESGMDLAEIEKFVSNQISSFIKPTKSKIARALKNA